MKSPFKKNIVIYPLGTVARTLLILFLSISLSLGANFPSILLAQEAEALKAEMITYEREQFTNSILSTGRLILFKEEEIPSDLEDFLSSLPDIHAKIVPEVGMLKLSSNSLETLKTTLELLESRYENIIEKTGIDPKISIPTPITSPSITVTTNPTTVSSAVYTDTASLYKEWGWDIQQVTENGKSYALQSGNHSVKVAIVDSGIDFNHPDLKGNIISTGKSFIPGVDNTSDKLGHGTMVAGVIAARGNLLGVGPNIGIVPYKVFDEGNGETSWIIEAIIQAARDDIQVINLSLGTYKSLTKEEDQAALLAYSRALLFAYNQGVIVVSSSGTDGLNISDPQGLAESLGKPGDFIVHAPGGLPETITVAATNKRNERAYYSNFGLLTMFAAPAGDYGATWLTKGELNVRDMCLTTYPISLPQSQLSQLIGLPQGYELMIGTSLAAPKVSATAALLIAESRDRIGRNLTPEEVTTLLANSVTDLGEPGPDPEFGIGLINANQALELLHTAYPISE
ncbi:S8 family serine peptidase [Paenibacillus apiarius]|uniref:S8 family serine peptidase n=1 Tax=Paenibacillus apiarius TaxID=46240 RepID=A0ABT4DNU1_9BACL|nr:S8 family serine peptidase [Paenibacillus apiarius]MCY9515491.1 S8 family serine peptidase [Paenibacillus apiarius]MCY9518900.1 S8 family serine peptidase [Paenibacillus apiarius]MCY9552054.1 S8 family serine peptidase [Paenibacillus apiarius]MCY9557270.1 S8 family serine peptidase [Paenibacillus apiarius]MCY9682551.1 S8 family serine peptidase [Paenibacillus apiarius]